MIIGKGWIVYVHETEVCPICEKGILLPHCELLFCKNCENAWKPLTGIYHALKNTNFHLDNFCLYCSEICPDSFCSKTCEQEYESERMSDIIDNPGRLLGDAVEDY